MGRFRPPYLLPGLIVLEPGDDLSSPDPGTAVYPDFQEAAAHFGDDLYLLLRLKRADEGKSIRDRSALWSRRLDELTAALRTAEGPFRASGRLSPSELLVEPKYQKAAEGQGDYPEETSAVHPHHPVREPIPGSGITSE
jgi:hypothetical protein